MKASMTEKYDPYENAIAERINGILKQEFGIARNIKNIDLKKQLIKSAVGTYNNFRPHLSNHMLTPVEMHKQKKLKRKQYKSKKLNDASIVKL
ncbi:integrase core domain-containing protein [Psychroflexus gondwanensis]|uniref:integrase core domain-containing protein n=1 Tax=Psychroflexus gondwanensis TaxID=251 RepID=UPI0021CF1674|nr:integrase core domain-containing protein [Psychroflexus gondwanensis]